MRTFDVVHDLQLIFRDLLLATSRPAEILTLPDVSTNAAEAVLLTLLDVEVTFRVLGPDGAAARELEVRLSSATGAGVAPVAETDFALIPGVDSDGAIRELKRGTLEAPETGATAIYLVDRLAEFAEERGQLALTISGPGVPGSRSLGVEGLSVEELENLQESRAYYPLGVDVYLVDGSGRLAGLPRSVRVEVVG